MIGQGLRGLVGQSLSGVRLSTTGLLNVYPAGSWTFKPTANGLYRFVIRGAGGTGDGSTSGGGSSPLVIADRYLSAGQPVTLVVGEASGSDGAASTVTLPTGEIMSSGGGKGGDNGGGAGIATAGPRDIVVPGAASIGGVGGAPGGYGSFLAGNGGAGFPFSAPSPGGGGSAGGFPRTGAPGQIVVQQIRP